MTLRAVLGLVLTVAVGCGSSPDVKSSPGPDQGTSRGPDPGTSLPSPPSTDGGDRAVNFVAHAVGTTVPVFESAGSGSPLRSLANPQPSGAPLVFLVQSQQPEWLEVLLPVRPNGSKGWVRRGDVSLSQHDFRIVVQLAAHRITVYKGSDVFHDEAIGVGTTDTPTPGGLYYTKELIKPVDDRGRYMADGPYGPFAYGLSGFSNVLTSFGGGDGVVGIHGTNDPSTLGQDVSHGCIRMSNPGITKLAETLPLGVPVEIRR